MRKIFKIVPFLLIPLLLTSCNIFKPAGTSSETTSVDPNSEATTEVDGVSISISGASQTVIGETIKLTLNMSDVSMIPTTINWSTSNSSVLARGTPNKNDHSCTFTGAGEGSATVTAKGKLKNTERTPFEITFDVSVAKPALAGIKFKNNESNENLGYTTYRDLEVVANPGAADLPSINWTTSNASVVSLSATTGSKVRVTAGSTTASATVTATTADGKYSASCVFNVAEIQYAKWTIMFYMCGSSLESGSDYGETPETMGYASDDISEMLAANGQPDSVNLVLECGGSEGWKNSKIQSHIDYLSRWHISSKVLIHDQDVPLVSMGEKTTLQSFMEYSIETYPAEKYGLILWNHGGAMEGVCYDEVGGGVLDALEVKEAADGARTNKGIANKFEFITYDACLMSVQEIAELNSYNFKYMLSSQETEVGAGYAYNQWLPTIFTNTSVSTKAVLQQIGETFLEENKAYASDQTQSVYDLSYMDAYKTAFNSFATDLAAIVNTSSKWNDFKSIVYSSSVQRYGNDHGNSRYDSYDICGSKGLLTYLKTNGTYSSLSTKITAVETALDNLVAWEDHYTGTTACGMSLFFPYKKSTISKANYQSQCNFTAWRNFVCTYW